MGKSILKERSFDFALDILKVAKGLMNVEKEYVLSKQLLRSGTAVGALIREAEFSQSKADFVHKMSIALKEANETLYWLELLVKGELLSLDVFESLHKECGELVAMLAASVKTAKSEF